MEKENYFSGSKFVTELTPKDFNSIETWKLKDKKCAIILFYAPWCPFCKEMKKVWEELGEKAAFFDVYAMNCEKHMKFCNKIREDNPELISSYPTMVIYKEGSPVEKVGVEGSKRNVGNFIKACMRGCDRSYHYIPVPNKKKKEEC